jgi:hypothetical protein
MNNLLTKTCLACNAILKGRTDKKFCNANCRNSYNNQQKGGMNNYARNIINSIRKNQKILESFLGGHEKVKASRHRMLTHGFQFRYHTHTRENKHGKVYFFCFEMGYRPIDQDSYIIVKQKEGID